MLDRVARGAARLAPWVAKREYRVARANLERCFTELDATVRAALLGDTLAHTARGIVELSHIWGQPQRRVLAQIDDVESDGALSTALAAGRGVIVIAPHLGAWELLNRWLASVAPLTILYRVPVVAELDRLLVDARAVDGVEALRAEPRSIRTLLARLRDGRMVGILPDQRARHGEGIASTFFGQPTRTMTLVARLAARTGAALVIAWAERLPNAAGYRIHLRDADGAIASADLAIAVRALDAEIEREVRRAPAQYQWTYKRFSDWKTGVPPRFGN